MIYSSWEDPIRYHLVKTTSQPSKDGSYKYHAVTSHDTIDMMDLARHNDRSLTDYIGHEQPVPALYLAQSVLLAMAHGVMTDGRSRKLGDLVLMRGDVTGTFDRIDQAYDPKVHGFEIRLVPLSGLAEFGRKDPPINMVRRPTGRIDHVTCPGGDFGQVRVGSEIEIHGHDLSLQPYDSVSLTWSDRVTGEKRRSTVYLDDEHDPGRFLEHTDTLIRMKWFGPASAREVLKREATLFVNPRTEDNASLNPRGSMSHVVVME